MTKFAGPGDPSQGTPNLGFLAYLQDNWTADNIADIKTKGIKTARIVIDADATSGKEIPVDIPLNATIIDAFVVATATNASGTVTIQTAAATPADIATALAMDTEGVVARMAAGVDDTKLKVTADGIQLVTAGVADRGIVNIYYIEA